MLQAYEPLDENDEDKAKISISNIVGDVMFVCSSQQVARVTSSFYLFFNISISYECFVMMRNIKSAEN